MSLSNSSGSPEDWPESPEIDHCTWELGPDPDDTRWLAEQNTSWDTDEPIPDEVLDRQAEEAAAYDYFERGYLPF